LDPEIVAVDAKSVAIARAERLGRAIFYRQERNAPNVYERPGKWPATRTIGNLPSVLGILSGPSRTVHALRAQSQLGSSWNYPPFTRLWPQGVISQIMSQRPSPIRDMLIARR
jgi:hypothetical protein